MYIDFTFPDIIKKFKEVSIEDPEYVNVYILQTDKNIYIVLESVFSFYTGNSYFFKLPEIEYIEEYFLSADKKLYRRIKRSKKEMKISKKEYKMEKIKEKIIDLSLLPVKVKIL